MTSKSMDEHKCINSKQHLMTKWWMNTEQLPPSNYMHLMAVTNIKKLGLIGHYWAINPPP